MTIKQQGGVFGRHPTFSTADIEGDFTVDSGLFYVDADTGRIGVGTVAPLDTANWGRAVDIRGASGSQGSVVYTGTSDASARAYFGTYSTSYALIGTQTNHNMLVWINNQNIGSFTSNGFAPVNGKGIDFSATSGTGTSELFDDYEEGTWTPVLSDGTNNATMGSAAGSYTKIGRQVFCKCRVVTTALGSVSGDIRVTGLPFTVAAGSGLENLAGGVASQGSGLAITAGSSISISPQQNTTRALLYVWDDVAGTTAMQATEWTDDGNAYFEFSYLA